jgi:hypothetical protein
MTGAQAGRQAVANQLLHTVTPLGALLDWLLRPLPGGLRTRDAALWLLCPLAYLIFACGPARIGFRLRAPVG